MNGEEEPESIAVHTYRFHCFRNIVQKCRAKSGKKEIVTVDHVLSVVLTFLIHLIV